MLEQIVRFPHIFLLSLILALATGVIWGYFFYRKNPVPLRNVFITALAGVFGIVPLILYHLSWYAIPDISIHYFIPQLLASPGWYAVAVFIVVSQVIAFLATLLTALTTLVVAAVTMTRGVISNVAHSFTREDSHFKFMGVLIALFGLMVVWLGLNPAEALILTVSFAALEEFVKHLVVRFIDDNRIRNIDDAIFYSVIVGIGFACIENFFFFFNAWFTGDLMQVFFFRAIISTFAHIFFSGVFGYFYGIAHFATPLYYDEVYRNRGRVVRTLEKIFHMKGDVVFHEAKVMQGLLIATALHAMFNYLVMTQQYIVLIPFLFLGFMLLSYLFESKEEQKEFRFISATRTTGKVHEMKPQYD